MYAGFALAAAVALAAHWGPAGALPHGAPMARGWGASGGVGMGLGGRWGRAREAACTGHISTNPVTPTFQAALAGAFLLEGGLFAFHIEGTALDVRAHTLLVCLVLGCAAATGAETAWPSSVELGCVRALLTWLQGVWFCVLARVLFEGTKRWPRRWDLGWRVGGRLAGNVAHPLPQLIFPPLIYDHVCCRAAQLGPPVPRECHGPARGAGGVGRRRRCDPAGRCGKGRIGGGSGVDRCGGRPWAGTARPNPKLAILLPQRSWSRAASRRRAPRRRPPVPPGWRPCRPPGPRGTPRTGGRVGSRRRRGTTDRAGALPPAAAAAGTAKLRHEACRPRAPNTHPFPFPVWTKHARPPALCARHHRRPRGRATKPLSAAGTLPETRADARPRPSWCVPF